MKKSLLALAAMGAFAGAAHAQSSVTVYGILDLGVTSQSNDNATNAVRQTTTARGGAYTTQRLGVSGTEDLGKGLRASFNFEMGLGGNGSTGNRLRQDTLTSGTTANTTDYKADQTLGDFVVRQQNLGLAGSFGSVRIGRMTTLADGVIGLGDVGGGNNFQGRAYSNTTAGGTNLINARSDRLIEYVSPTMSGLSIGVQYGTAAGTNSTTVAAERLNENSATEFGAMIRYSAGPANAGVGFQSHKEKISNADRRESTVVVVAGSYNFNVAQVFLNYQNGEIKNDYGTATTPTQAAPFSTVAFQTGALNKRNVSEIGVAVPVGALRLAGSYYMGTRENQTSATGAVAKSDLTGYQAAALYSLSKRTNLYAVYGATKSDTAGVATNVADYGVGVRHSF